MMFETILPLYLIFYIFNDLFNVNLQYIILHNIIFTCTILFSIFMMEFLKTEESQ